jgi:hypothetical protein
MTKPSEHDLLETARRLLHESERTQDEFTVARLRAARLRALEATPKSLWLGWRMVGSLATAGAVAMLAGIVWFHAPLERVTPAGNETIVAEIDLLATESPEFYTELEFYDWLVGEADAS